MNLSLGLACFLYFEIELCNGELAKAVAKVTITAELFPTKIRATAQGFTYNIGRGLSAIAPFTIGALAKTYGLGIAFYLTAASFLFSALVAFALPETKGKELE